MTTPTPAPTIKPGIQTTEWWGTVLLHVAWVLSLIFHKDFSGYVPAAAIGAASIATAVYALSRAHVKFPGSVSAARSDVHLVAPVVAEVKGDAAKVEAAIKAVSKKPSA